MKSHDGLLWLRASVLAALTLTPPLLMAKDAIPNLGGGLEQMAKGAAALAEPELFSPLQLDDQGRALVRISLTGEVSTNDMLNSMRAASGIEVMAWDANISDGMIEAYVPPAELKTWAVKPGVLAIVPASPMVTNVGLTDSQGVVQHRVDQIPGVDGSGITIGVMSDSYGTRLTPTSAAGDIVTGDLPGVGNPLGNAEPVVVVEDVPTGTDEGRAMLQIVHDMAPKARLGFATANGGELNFANNIRSLAGLPGAPRAVPGFKADVIVDDIIYLAEPFFQDGIVAQAVDDVAEAGVSYFSSAGNRPATQAYDSKVRIVPPDASSMQGTNLDFTNVDPALFAGGFHDFAPGSGVDIAQTVQFNNGSTIVFQWNEPFDPPMPRPVGAPLAAAVGTVPVNGSSAFTFDGTVGQVVQILIEGDTTTTGVSHPDVTFAVTGPDNTLIQFVDTSGTPESLTLELPQSGTYRVVVGSFQPAQSGDFRYRVQPVQIIEQVVSDYNLLFFRMDGTFLRALSERNTFTNRPLELGTIRPAQTLQVVIARANTPTGNRRGIADRIRYVGFSGVNPQEYFSYLDSVTYGHNSARGAMGVAAYAFFAPFVPENFTSPGPSTIYFDENNRRFSRPEIRQKPDLAAMDGANTTFFGGDSPVDADAFPNFFGTSAAAPHAAAIAALVLDAAGGPGKVKPKKMREILQDSAFRHDLDPYFSSGFAVSLGNVFSINSAADQNGISQFDPNVFTLQQFGLRKLQSLSINVSGGNTTQTPTGIVFDERGTPLPAPGQPFVVGRTSGLTAADVSATFSLPADPPGLPGQWKQLDLSFAAGSFASGDLLSFGVDRDEADVAGPGGAAAGNSADLLGGGVLIPSGRLVPGGASFTGRFEGGAPFKGEFFNLIGRGYSQLDGYGFVNAEAAVKAVSKDKDKSRDRE
jgi:hypothetical protein